MYLKQAAPVAVKTDEEQARPQLPAPVLDRVSQAKSGVGSMSPFC